MIDVLLKAGVCVLALLTAGGMVKRTEWWFRGCDFPRLQVMALAVLLLVGFVLQGVAVPADVPWLLLLLWVFVHQGWQVLPYTPLWPIEVQHCADADANARVSLLVSNVLGTNTQHHRLIALIEREQPDVVLTLETDLKWQQALAVIEPQYPHRVAVPLDNLYGMHLYSRLPLLDPQVRYLFSEEIPSIHTGLRLRNGHVVRLYCLHPKPPSPTEAHDSTLRDAELLLVGRHIEQHHTSAIVWGDLNDVAWSDTNRLFQKISGLLDPRIGRRMINTFHARWWFFRWALDHIFHSDDFGLVRIARMPDIGSDHFPVLTVLAHMPALQHEQIKPQADQADVAEAQQKIEEGLDAAESRSHHMRIRCAAADVLGLRRGDQAARRNQAALR